MAEKKSYDTKYEMKPNNGSLFACKTKLSEKSPDYQGTVLIDLSEFEIVDNQITVSLGGWKKQWAEGTYLSLKASKVWIPDASGSAVKRTKEDFDVPF